MSHFSSTSTDKVHSMPDTRNSNYACAQKDAVTRKMALVAAAVFLVLLVEVWVVSFFVGVVGFPGGAPVSACSDLTPFHGARLTGFAIEEIRDRPAPFILKTNQIEPNSYEGVISGNIPFRGFMVQARIDGSQQIAGKFIRFDRDITKTLTCSQHDDTITHTNDNPKKQITFVWHVNDLNMPESRIHIVATVAKSYSEFWTNVTSEAITIGSSIKEMKATKSATPSHSGPEGRWGAENTAKPSLNIQGNQKYQQRRQRWQQSPVTRLFLDGEELQLPPEIDALIPQLPIPPTDSWWHQHFNPVQSPAPTRNIEPQTASTQDPFVSHLNKSLVQEAPNLLAETTGSRPSQQGWDKQQTTTQSREQHVTEIFRSLKQTTPRSVDATRMSVNSLGVSKHFKLSLRLQTVIISLILFFK